MIELINVYKEYAGKKGKIVALNNVSLTIGSGSIFGIIGRSGAGKSTLLRSLNLLEKPTSGQIIVDGTSITTLKGRQLRQKRHEIGMIFQHFHLISAKTVYQNVAFSLKAAGKPKEEIERRVPQLLELVGLTDKSHHYPSQLSGGQKQRVGIARALANHPKVLLCDEATSALDPETTRQILTLLKDLNEKLNITIVLVTHEMEVIKEICHEVAVMQNGQIIETGKVYDVFANPKHSLTQSLIETVMDFQLPSRLLNERTGTIVKIQFQGEMAERGIIAEMLKSFNVDGNILHGKIEYIQGLPLGILVIELIGEHEEVERAIGFLQRHTARLEVIDDVLTFVS